MYEIKRIKLLNKIVILFSGFVSIKLIQEIVVQDLMGTLIGLGIMVVFMATLGFNYLEKIKSSRIYFTTILTLTLCTLNILFGRDFGSEFAFFPLITIIIIFFDKQHIRLYWVLFAVFCYGLSSVYLYNNEPILIENLSKSAFYFMFLSCFFSVFLASSFFINENRDYSLKAQELLKTLQSKNERLENVNEELERFAYVASHDLKTPLRNINSFLNLIQRKVRKGQTDEISEYLEFATLNARRMHTLIEDILEFSRFSNGEFSFENKDLNSIVDLAVSNITNVIKEKKALISIKKLPNIYCNEAQMVSLFQNLIENGIKYNEARKPEITIQCDCKALEYQIKITDNGIGIKEEYQAKIFDMFYRLHNQGEYQGSGIGLSTCKKIATYHGGDVVIDSTLGKGSVFTIILPKHSQDETLSKAKYLKG